MNELRCIKTVKEVRNDDNRGGRVVTVVSGGVCGVSEIISLHPHPPRVRYTYTVVPDTGTDLNGKDVPTMNQKDTFQELVENMNLYRSEEDKQLGVVCAVAMTAYNIDATEAAKLLRALVVLGRTHRSALFADCVSSSLIELYPTNPEQMNATIERIAAFLSKCGSVEEFERIAQTNGNVPPTLNN